MNRINALTIAALLFTGCASYEEMKQQRDVLAAKLAVTEDQMKDLEKEKDELRKQVKHLTGVTQVLEKEKTERIKESTEVRGEVRGFIREQVSDLREFSQAKELLDYIGSELLERKTVTGEGLLLLDMKNAMPKDATLVGARVYARAATAVSLCLARPQGGNYIVLWKSKDFTIPKPGQFRLTFEAPIAAQKGDIIGCYTAGAMQVPYDIATGDARAVRIKPSVGKVIEKRSIPDATGRTYSFGVVGFLE